MTDATTARGEADQPEKSPSPPPQPRHRSRSASGGRQTPPQQDFEAENVVEADTEDDGASSRAGDEVWDEGFDGSSIGNHSASTSLSNSVRDYVFENTRRYHKYMEGRYLMPNDEPEQEREDMKHAMCVNVMDGKLHCAPLENPQKIIDIGTGTGIWAIDSESSLSISSHDRLLCACYFDSVFMTDTMAGRRLGWTTFHRTTSCNKQMNSSKH